MARHPLIAAAPSLLALLALIAPALVPVARALAIEGSVRAMVEPETVGDPQIPLPVAHSTVRLDGTPAGQTDSEGDFSIEVPDDSDRLLEIGLSGLYCRILNDGGPPAGISAIVRPGQPRELLFDDSNSDISERDAYSHANRIHDWIKRIDPDFTALDYEVQVHVNNNFATCGASWHPAGIYFYVEGSGCNNTGRISDVIYHEYGHGISRGIYAPQDPPTANGMEEAYSDIAAMTINNDPEIAEYFIIGDPGGIRTGENLRQYPGNECGGNPFCLGEILMGAMWKLRRSLNELYGPEMGGAVFDDLHVRTLHAKPTTMPVFLEQLLLMDDDDGNLGNGTPHWDQICDAFGQHSLSCPPLNNEVGEEGAGVFPSDPVSVLPNPSSGAFSIRFGPTTGEIVEVSVFDVAGRLVRRLGEGSHGPGARSVHWDGRSDLGEPVGSGIYLLRFRSAGGMEGSRALIVIR